MGLAAKLVPVFFSPWQIGNGSVPIPVLSSIPVLYYLEKCSVQKELQISTGDFQNKPVLSEKMLGTKSQINCEETNCQVVVRNISPGCAIGKGDVAYAPRLGDAQLQ